ncbi:hypothetical protein IEN85_24220 [Pelagicoccus sp. NFK12]|uniref:Uncharacterized protein n=1 Tax=Pelagicoccus enzymogenes TaxID=2773457 RepID=A0A927IKH6_9BACT|nr:hypothetical protein [Pelagicoccus enzymogenes]
MGLELGVDEVEQGVGVEIAGVGDGEVVVCGEADPLLVRWILLSLSPELGFLLVGEVAMDGTWMEELLSELGGELVVVGAGVRDEGVGLPDEL